MAFFQSSGNIPLFIVTSSKRARYGIMASPPILSVSPGMPPGPTDLCFPIYFVHLQIVLMLMVNGLIVFSPPKIGILSLIEYIVENRNLVGLPFLQDQ